MPESGEQVRTMDRMARRTPPATETAAEGDGVFGWIGRAVVRSPLLVIALLSCSRTLRAAVL